MTDEPSESNPTCSDDSALKESMWHIISSENFQKKRVYFWCGPWEASFLTSNSAYLDLDSPSWFCTFFYKVSCWHPYPIEIDFE